MRKEKAPIQRIEGHQPDPNPLHCSCTLSILKPPMNSTQFIISCCIIEAGRLMYSWSVSSLKMSQAQNLHSDCRSIQQQHTQIHKSRQPEVAVQLCWLSPEAKWPRGKKWASTLNVGMQESHHILKREQLFSLIIFLFFGIKSLLTNFDKTTDCTKKCEAPTNNNGKVLKPDDSGKYKLCHWAQRWSWSEDLQQHWCDSISRATVTASEVRILAWKLLAGFGKPLFNFKDVSPCSVTVMERSHSPASLLSCSCSEE